MQVFASILGHVALNYAGINIGGIFKSESLFDTIRLPFASTTLHIREDLHSRTSLFSISLINTEVLLISLMGMYNIAYTS